jgi:hypothetical protein
LVKKGHRRRNWNRRFFVLYKGLLHYFADEDSGVGVIDKVKNGKKIESKGKIVGSKVKHQKGYIELRDYTLLPADENVTSYKYCFLLEGKKSFLIRAENQQDYESWLTVINFLVCIVIIFIDHFQTTPSGGQQIRYDSYLQSSPKGMNDSKLFV